MAIINFLPEFKLVEINRSTGLVMGHVLAQFPLDPGFAGIIDDYEYDMVENGFIMGLGSDLEVDEYDPARHAQPFLLYTEELNTFFDGLKWYANGADEEDGIIYPRLVGLYLGDAFTTDNFDGTYTNQKFAKVVGGKLTLQATKDADTMFAVEESTLPTGDEALRFVFIGVFGTGSTPVTTTAAPTTTTTAAPTTTPAPTFTVTINLDGGKLDGEEGPIIFEDIASGTELGDVEPNLFIQAKTTKDDFIFVEYVFAGTNTTVNDPTFEVTENIVIDAIFIPE
jgi:hypothetical protein